MSKPLRVRAEILYSAINSDGIHVNISRFPPKGFPFSFGKVTDLPATADMIIYDSIEVKMVKGAFKKWRDHLITTQLFMDFSRTDTSFICEFDILFKTTGVMQLLVPGWSFDNNSCSAGFRIRHALNSRNYNFFEEVKQMPFVIHSIEDANPQFIKIIP